MRRHLVRLSGLVLLGSTTWAQVTVRVSVSSAGTQTNDDSGPSFAAITPDGRYVTFMSDASNLVPGDTNPWADVFVRDRQTGATERVSVSSSGAQGDNLSAEPAISADGRYVVFTSYANNLVPGDSNQYPQVFLRDRQAGTTERVSSTPGGAQGSTSSQSPSISADGRYVAFWSTSNNLVPGDTNGFGDAFVRDRIAGTTEIVSLDSAENQANSGSVTGTISQDGRFVVFSSLATNLVPGDANGNLDLFLRDRQTGTTEVVSIATGGATGNGNSYPDCGITPDGRYVVFHSLASDLVPGDTNGFMDAFLRDRIAGSTELISVDSVGTQGNGITSSESVSADGRFVAFSSAASNLVPGDTNQGVDVFLRDRQTGTTERASVDPAMIPGNGSGYRPRITPDARYVSFFSISDDLVPGDTNGFHDVFVRDREYTALVSFCDPGAGGVISCPCTNPPSGSGRGCDNSAVTGGASLAAYGGAFHSSDSLVFTTSGEKPTALSIVLQGTTSIPAGAVYGQGVRCVGGSLKRLYTKSASGGSITAPDFGAGDPSVHARSAALGDLIPPGGTRFYMVYYRDPVVLGGCPATNTFNTTQSGQVGWSP